MNNPQLVLLFLVAFVSPLFHGYGELCQEKMKLVPAGVLLGNDLDFGPVSVSNTMPLWVDATEITGACWEKVLEWGKQHGYQFSWFCDKVEFDGDEYPVKNVTFFDAILWCNARSEMDMLLDPCYTTESGFVYRSVLDRLKKCHFDRTGFRLPTCQEWEYAARGSTTTRFYWGDICDYSRANYFCKTNGVISKAGQGDNREKGTMPVASFEPNRFGLYDMAGNVSEWCWMGVKEDLQSVRYACLKGGSWSCDSNELRHHVGKTTLASDDLLVSVFKNVGFRCVRKGAIGVVFID